MKCYRLLWCVLAVAMSSASALAQVPVPVPDPDFGIQSPPDVCVVCSGIEDAIDAQRAAYDALSNQIDANEVEIDQLEQDKLTIQNAGMEPGVELWCLALANMMIFDLQDQIADLEAQQQVIANTINGLWDSWFASDCDEANC